MCNNNSNPQPAPWLTSNPNLGGLLDNWAAGDHVVLLTAGGLVQGVLSAFNGSIVRLSPATIFSANTIQVVTISNTPYSTILTAGILPLMNLPS